MPETRPNIILIMTDQQRYDTIGALGFPHVDTPHLDRLAREGTWFTNLFVTAASCAPARPASLPGTIPTPRGSSRTPTSGATPGWRTSPPPGTTA